MEKIYGFPQRPRLTEKRIPKNIPHKMFQQEEKKIKNLRNKHPQLGCKKT